jgi:hypothetical protein
MGEKHWNGSGIGRRRPEYDRAGTGFVAIVGHAKVFSAGEGTTHEEMCAHIPCSDGLLKHPDLNTVQKFGPDAETVDSMKKNPASARAAAKKYSEQLAALVQLLSETFKTLMSLEQADFADALSEAKAQLKCAWKPIGGNPFSMTQLENQCKRNHADFLMGLKNLMSPLLKIMHATRSVSKQTAMLSHLQPGVSFVSLCLTKSDRAKQQYELALTLDDNGLDDMSCDEIMLYANKYQQFDKSTSKCFWALWCPLKSTFEKLGVEGR